MKNKYKTNILRALTVMLTLSTPAFAEEFLNGKTVRIVTTGTPGGQSDQMARIFADALNRFYPSSKARVENMRQQGNVVALKEVYESGPREIDIAIISAGPIFKQMTTDNLPFDLSNMPAIGSLASSNYLVALRNDTNWDFTENSQTQSQLKIGVHYSASSDYLISQLLNSQTNLDILAVPGFETDIMVSTLLAGDFNAILMAAADPVSQNFPSELKPLLLIGQSSTYPEYTHGTPRLREVITSTAENDIVNVIEKISDAGRILLAEPSISSDDMRDLEAAFSMIVRDVTYVSNNHDINVEISPTSGSDVDILLDALLSPTSVIASEVSTALVCGEARSATRSKNCE